MHTVRPFGKRVLVKKKKIDVGALRVTPGMEEDGVKNTGEILAVGDIGILAHLRGIGVGKEIHFRKFFSANNGTDEQLVFVDLDAILGISEQ